MLTRETPVHCGLMMHYITVDSVLLQLATQCLDPAQRMGSAKAALLSASLKHLVFFFLVTSPSFINVLSIGAALKSQRKNQVIPHTSVVGVHGSK